MMVPWGGLSCPQALNLSLTSPLFFSILLISTNTRKIGCDTGTCVTNKLADKLRERGGKWKYDFMPTGIGHTPYGRRRRRDDEE